MSETRDIARRLRTARTEAGLSQEALAERAGLHIQTIRMIEYGHSDPRFGTLLQLAEVIGEQDWLLDPEFAPRTAA